jgi:hypothetical protein|tara:strand:+ start:3634 stop:4041 length:408 start_codon:yes stop_codon:yes gene_type:complete
VIETLDRAALKALRSPLQAALDVVAKEHGISIKVGSGSYSFQNASLKLELAVKDSTGNVITPHRADWNVFAKMIPDLNESWLDETFTFKNETYKVTGYNSSARVRPIVTERVSNGKTYTWKQDALVRFMARKEVA